MIQIVREPRGRIYRALLAHAIGRTSHFSLVWRQQLTFHPTADQYEAALRPFLCEETLTDRWPGTQLLDSLAAVRRYLITADSIRMLEPPGRLFAWLAPSLPEDLAFYLPSGSCWLGSISHERDAWLNEPAEFVPALLQAIPGLSIRLAP
jgi:hypothetical protein